MQQEIPSDKSYTIAVILSGVFGVVGVQHFYLGRTFEATIDLGMFIATIYLFFTGQLLWALLVGAVDALHTFIVTIMLLTGSFRDGQGRLVCYPGQKLNTGDSI
jgi:TM2 domain-containing membrane protein YozV